MHLSKCEACLHYRFITVKDDEKKLAITIHQCSKHDRTFINAQAMDNFARKCEYFTPSKNYGADIAKTFELVSMLNKAFQNICKKYNLNCEPFLSEDFMVASKLIKDISSEDDYREKIEELAKIFEKNADDLKELIKVLAARRKLDVNRVENDLKGLRTIKSFRYLIDKIFGLENLEWITDTWEKIVVIRTYYSHRVSSDKIDEIKKAYEYFGLSYPPQNYISAWEAIIRKFNESLESAIELLITGPRTIELRSRMRAMLWPK